MTTNRILPHPPAYDWQPQPEAAKLINEVIVTFLDACPSAANLASRMKSETGTRFRDWIDYIEIPADSPHAALVEETGFTLETSSTDDSADLSKLYRHHGGLFPLIQVSDSKFLQIGIKVDSVSDFLAAWSITNDYPIEGEPFATLRRVPVFCETATALWAVERHGCNDLTPDTSDAQSCLAALRHFESFRRRKRDWRDDQLGWDRVNQLADRAIADLGVDQACDLFFYAERDYWQKRNRAAILQKARQDELGLGWANHDHHTYRSSRQDFAKLIALFEKFGFICRERFYAGADAGWGAQVLEQPECGFVIFADVDMTEKEVAGDFSHDGLEPRDYLGTVGLWVGLHGESMLQAGMHHLECQFDFDSLRDQLNSIGVRSMPAFTDLPHLRQAFTEGERWGVKESRIDSLLQRKLITPAQANQFRMQGAIGSHLENLERHDGYKGFNQHGVSDIIERTDPRKEAALLGA